MSGPTTIPMTASATAASKPISRTWSPTDRERLIFQWVKFDGHTQGWVAQQLGINQSTVSRIVERYERWIARGGPAREGALSHDERVRAQYWLTYERNEWIIASALRLAGELERAVDSTRSNITHHASQPSREVQVRTEHKVLDRSGMVNRYLRLAHRVNMDQHKLVEKEPLPALEPLTFDDANAELPPDEQSLAARFQFDREQDPDGSNQTPAADPATPTSSEQHSMHGVHNHERIESCSTQDTAETCVETVLTAKSLDHAYAVVNSPPETADEPHAVAHFAIPKTDFVQGSPLFEPLVCAPQLTHP